MVKRLEPDALAGHLDAGGRILDVREPPVFADRHVRGALNVALSNRGAPYWVNALVAPRERLAVVTATDREGGIAGALLEASEREAIGWLPFDEDALSRAGLPLASFRTITPDELAEGEPGRTVVDVRSAHEYAGGHVPGAFWIPLEELAARVDEVPRAALATICASGFRSSTAASILEAAGRSDLANVWGGTTAWTQLGHPVERGAGR